MEKPTCEVLQDLLPSYCDGVTGDSVSEMLQKHLEECTNCKDKYQEIIHQREWEASKEISKGQKFKEKLKGLHYYMIGIVIGFFGPIICLVLWLLYIWMI